ncbi:zinc-binding alcohol dehydrogenase family protein [Sphingomonas sp.]|jgi:2-desacetyl-2-hydroxyethyl bacteriochlorophyllide A dehydrogenase|uniref:zinc-binding alcohol dehydrogenase family protein n=1 Tax=Sphingomonas sp. TaxID=28214 RepID=UPI002EDA848C
MKAVVCERPLALSVVTRAMPDRAPGEVMLRIRRIGLCGTDFHIYAGRQPFLTYPRVMGHELAGEVVEADAGSRLTPGLVVTVNPYLPCGTCIACRKGKPNCCMTVQVLGVHVDGGMCEYLSVPEHAVVPAGGLTLDQAAMVEFLAVGAHAVGRGTLMPGEAVLVSGAGPIGVAVALFCGMAGARVTLIDTSVERLAHARDAVGIDDVVTVDAATAATLAHRTGGEHFDCVFDATGNVDAMCHGLSYVAHGGRYVLVSVVKDDLVFPDPEFHKRETTLLGSRNATHADFAQVIARIADGSVPTAALQTHSFPALDAARHVPELIAGQGRVLKAIATF